MKKWFECAALGCSKKRFMRKPFTDSGRTWLCGIHFRRSLPICKEERCQSPCLHWDGFCGYHHAITIGAVIFKSHSPHFLPCSIQLCENRIICKGRRTTPHRRDRVCLFHKNRITKGFLRPLNHPKIDMKGPGNPRWKGGISQYPNHSLFKKQRLIKLGIVGYKCELCRKGGKLQAHHVNRDKSDHRLENLKIVHARCHGKLHRGRKNNPIRTSNLIRKYGRTLKRWSLETGLTRSTICGILYGKNRKFSKLSCKAERIAEILPKEST